MKTAVETIFAGQERALQSPLPADVQPLPRRPGRVHAGLGLGEGTGREPGRARARAVLCAPRAGEELRGAERLAARPGDRLRQGASSSRVPGSDDLAGLRGRAGRPRALCGPVRRVSMRCRPRSRRPASCGSTTTATRWRRARSDGRSRSEPMRSAVEIRQDGRVVGEHPRALRA